MVKVPQFVWGRGGTGPQDLTARLPGSWPHPTDSQDSLEKQHPAAHAFPCAFFTHVDTFKNVWSTRPRTMLVGGRHRMFRSQAPSTPTILENR